MWSNQYNPYAKEELPYGYTSTPSTLGNYCTPFT